MGTPEELTEVRRARPRLREERLRPLDDRIPPAGCKALILTGENA